MTKRKSQVKCALCAKTITKKEQWLHLYVYGSMDRDYYEKIVGPEDFIKKSFEFLLKIRQYFAKYEEEIKKIIQQH